MSQYLLTDEQVANAIRDLPALSQVVSQSLEMIDKDDLDFNELADLLKYDPGISSRLLKLANSPFYGLSGQISSITEACTVLGIYTIRNILLSAAALDYFPVEENTICDRKALWIHSFSVASISKFIARKLKLDHDAAFTAGLLHDIGKFVLDVSFPDELNAVINHMGDEKYLQFKIERDVLGIDHSSIGSQLAQKWNFPELVINSIENHHDFDNALNTPVIDVVQTADIITHSLDSGEDDENFVLPSGLNSISRLGITSEQLTEWQPEFIELQSISQTLLNL